MLLDVLATRFPVGAECWLKWEMLIGVGDDRNVGSGSTRLRYRACGMIGSVGCRLGDLLMLDAGGGGSCWKDK